MAISRRTKTNFLISMNNFEELKRLQAEKKLLLEKSQEDIKLCMEFQKVLTQNKEQLKQINRAIEALDKEIVISDHAILRYLERVSGHKDLIKQARIEIERLTKNAPANCKWPIGSNLIAVVSNSVISTIKPQKIK